MSDRSRSRSPAKTFRQGEGKTVQELPTKPLSPRASPTSPRTYRARSKSPSRRSRSPARTFRQDEGKTVQGLPTKPLSPRASPTSPRTYRKLCATSPTAVKPSSPKRKPQSPVVKRSPSSSVKSPPLHRAKSPYRARSKSPSRRSRSPARTFRHDVGKTAQGLPAKPLSPRVSPTSRTYRKICVTSPTAAKPSSPKRKPQSPVVKRSPSPSVKSPPQQRAKSPFRARSKSPSRRSRSPLPNIVVTAPDSQRPKMATEQTPKSEHLNTSVIAKDEKNLVLEPQL